MPKFHLREIEAGELLHEEKFTGTDLEAEHFQADRWNRNYSSGEPRVSSRLYKLTNGRWRRYMTIGL